MVGLASRGGARYEEAFACYERAIQLQPDHSETQFMLGVSLDIGEGVPRNDAMATAWYHKAANQGLKEAQYNLGLSYYFGCADGSGLGPDYEQAAHCFRRAAEQGFEPAQDKLGSLYGLGLVVPQDPAEAFRCYETAARQGYKEAQRIVGDLRRDGQRIFHDYAEAAWWYHKAALQGDLPAQISLAQMYLQELVPRSLSLGFTSGAANGEDAPGNWGRDGVIYWRYSCKVGAAYWFGKAAQQGSAVAISALSELQPFLALEHAKEILKDSRSEHCNFGSNVEARKRHTAKIRDAVTVLENAGYKLNKRGYGLSIQ
jgi:TPR repeat protein